MSVPAGEAWSALLQDVRHRVSPQEFQNWLLALHPSADADRLCLEAPNLFHQQIVEDRFAAILRESAVRLFGPLVSVVFSAGNGAHADTVEAPPLRPSPVPRDDLFESYTNTLTRASRPLNAEGRPRRSTPLNPKYTFDHFVVGKSNQFAHATARAVAEHPATTYNPLFIFGDSGLGKTHIMQAIGNHILRTAGDTLVHYASAESFMNEMIGSIQSGRTIDFRNKYRKIDVLLIDDVHFLQGKESTQEEFFHTFNALYDSHKQIVLTSDRPPKEIPTLEERLVSRFEWGLVTDIQPPDLETRIAILRNRAEDDELLIPDAVLEFIASSVRSNIRELEGSLIRLLAFASMTGSELNLALARDVLKDYLKQPERIISVERIQTVVADHYGIPEEAMKIRKRTNSIAFPRQLAMYLCRELTKLSLSDIGTFFGGRDHTTVMHACEKITQARDQDPQLRQILQRLIAMLQSERG